MAQIFLQKKDLRASGRECGVPSAMPCSGQPRPVTQQGSETRAQPLLSSAGPLRRPSLLGHLLGPGPAEALSRLSIQTPPAQAHFLPCPSPGAAPWFTIYTSYPIYICRIQPATPCRSVPSRLDYRLACGRWLGGVASEPYKLRVRPRLL